MRSNRLYSSEVKAIYESKLSFSKLADEYGVSRSTIVRIKSKKIVGGIPDSERDNDLAGRRLQKATDNLRLERKTSREARRSINLIEEINNELVKVLETHKLSNLTRKHEVCQEPVVGVIQLSDIHFGERIDDANGNVYDLSILSKRLKKFIVKAKKLFSSIGVKSVLVAMTGDLVNSDRRLDEITSNANNRSKIIFTAVEMLQQVILELNEEFNVTVASVCGNESRVGKEVGWANFTASDNYDATIHNVLSYLFKGAEGVKFIEMNDPLECVVDVNGHNFLLIHGHNGTANGARIENEVAKLRSKYLESNIKIDYVLCGHIHSAYVSDFFSRSSGMPGGNSYSAKALNLPSKASQNVYVVYRDSIDSMKIDLQNYGNDGYDYNKSVEEYKPIDEGKGTVVIQSVLI